MKVALFLPSLRGGGAERVMVALARAFVERRRAVDMVLVRAEGAYRSAVPDQVRIIDLDAPTTSRSLPALVRYLRRVRPDVVISAMDHANVVAICARRLSRVPTRLVATVHEPPGYSASRAASLKARVLPHFLRRFYPLADELVAVSRGVADDLARTARIPRSSIHVIYNPIITPELRTQAREPLQHPWFEPGSLPVVLAVGRLTAQKDFSTLIRAFAILREQRAAKLLILGEGEERRELERLIAGLGLVNDVAMPGFVENPFQFMKRAAVFVLSSRREGLPSVLIEALACGAPVVSTDCRSGPREILCHGRWGALVPVGDPPALSESIRSALDRDRRPWDQRLVTRPFDADRAASRYLQLMQGRLC